MDNFDAVMIAEGYMPPPGTTPEERTESLRGAWQHLIDTGLAWRLQGWFGRSAVQLLESGFCTPPPDHGSTPLETS